MIFLRQTPPAFLYRVEIGVILQLQRLERVHLVPRAAAVARSAPAMIGAVLIAARVAPLRPLALFAFLLVEALKIVRSEEHTSELQSLMRISYAVFCLKKKNNQ